MDDPDPAPRSTPPGSPPPRPATSVASSRGVWVALGVAVSFVPFGVRPWWVGLLGAFAVVAALRAWLGRSVRPIAFAVGLVLPVAFLAGVVGLVVAVPTIQRRLHARTFDPVAWKLANDEKDISSTGPRATMLDDLLDRRILIGKTRAAVEELLGPPLGPYADDGGRLRYLVGWIGGFMMIDPSELVVEFGSDGRVTGTSLCD